MDRILEDHIIKGHLTNYYWELSTHAHCPHGYPVWLKYDGQHEENTNQSWTTRPMCTVDEAIYQLTKQVHWIVRSLEYITLRLGRFHRAKHFWGIIIKRMRASSFKNIIAASKLYGSNQIEGTHFSFVIENLYVSEFLTLIFSQKASSFVKALHVGFHGKFQDKFLLCNVNVFSHVLKAS